MPMCAGSGQLPTSADGGAPVVGCKPGRFDWQVYGVEIDFVWIQTDPEETPTDLTSPPRSGQSHPYSGPAEGDASARSTARNCGYDRRKPSGIRSTQGDRSLTLSRSRSRGCAGTGAWAPMPGGRPLTVSGTVGAVDHAFVREAAALEPAARGAAVTWRVSALFRPAAGAVEAAAAA